MTKITNINPAGAKLLRKHIIRHERSPMGFFASRKVSLAPLPAPHIIDGVRRGGGNGDSGSGVRA